MSNVWQRTRVPNLLRHKGGRYYGRFTISGKGKFFALKTDVFEVAKIRLAEKRVDIERSRQARKTVEEGTCTMGDLVAFRREQIAARSDLAPRTKTRLAEHLAYLGKTWSGFEQLKPSQITRSAIEAWKSRALSVGTGYRPPNAKGACVGTRGASAGTFNKAVDALRGLLDLAVERGAIASNPIPKKRFKMKLAPRKPKLPEAKTLHAICREIETGGGPRGIEAADFCRFLMFTGCRKSEAAAVRWADIDLERGVICVRGTKTIASSRNVPIIPAARALIEKVRARRLAEATTAVDGVRQIDPVSAVLGVQEAQKSLTRACEANKVERLTHHDFRDAFTTQCIEAGVDIPTIARWLGHVDGGTLLMKTYGHLREQHSAAQAAKVSF